MIKNLEAPRATTQWKKGKVVGKTSCWLDVSQSPRYLTSESHLPHLSPFEPQDINCWDNPKCTIICTYTHLCKICLTCQGVSLLTMRNISYSIYQQRKNKTKQNLLAAVRKTWQSVQVLKEHPFEMIDCYLDRKKCSFIFLGMKRVARLEAALQHSSPQSPLILTRSGSPDPSD